MHCCYGGNQVTKTDAVFQCYNHVHIINAIKKDHLDRSTKEHCCRNQICSQSECGFKSFLALIVRSCLGLRHVY